MPYILRGGMARSGILKILAIAALVAAGRAALAQNTSDPGAGTINNQPDTYRDDERYGPRERWDRGEHYGWRNHHRHRVCRWVWRYHHRVRVCTWRRW